MERLAAISISALCATLSAAPAAAYHLNEKTQAIHIVSLQDFDRCQKDYESSGSEVCLDALKVYARKHPSEAFDAGKRARRHFMHWVALDFFAQALSKKPSSKARCEDPDVSAAVVSGLALPPHYPAVELARKIVSEACWGQLEPVVVADLEGAGANFRGNTCTLLADKNVSNPQCKASDIRPKPPAPNAVAELKGVDWKKLDIDPESPEALSGTNGEELMVARTKPGAQEYVLLKFKSVRSPWNEQVLVAIERNAGFGKDYVVLAEGKEWVAMTERQGHYQGFPKGMPDGIWLYSTRPSKEALKLPTRRAIASEFATADTPAK